MRLFRAAAALVASVALMSCGGGGGSSGTTPFGSGSGSDNTGGSGGTSKPVAADMSLGLSATSVNNSGSKTIVATATAVDAARNAVSGVPVTISVDNNAVAQVSGATTGADGTLAATVSIGADRSNRIVTVTATSGSVSRTASFQVTGAKLSATLDPIVAPNSSSNEIKYRLVDVNENPMADQTITVTAPGLADVTGTTDSTGSYKYLYTAPSTTGSLEFTAMSGGAPLPSTVLVQSTAIPSACTSAGCITSQSISANPSVVSVNSATSDNRSNIRALFLGAGNLPIKNVRVRFDLGGDPNNIGGSLSTQSNLVYTDPNGVATTAYIPGPRSSPTNGVIVRACFSADDFPAGSCPPNSVQTTLTVVSEALSVTIGTDNTITDGSGGLTYVKKFVVLVVDSSGQAKPDVQLSASIDLLDYIKGYYDGPGAWNRKAPSAANPTPVIGSIGFTGPTCLNEDGNRNGVLEIVNGTSEDFNQNGQLDPRKSDVAVSFVGSSVTTANGTAVLQIEYPKNVATWLDYKILIAASGVSGTEGRAAWSGRLPADAGSFTATTPPAFVFSPYGSGNFDSNGDTVVDCRDKD